MNASLSTNNHKSMVYVAEGCTRLVCKYNDNGSASHLLDCLVDSVLVKADATVKDLTTDAASASLERHSLTVDMVGACLGVIQTIIRFCDTTSHLELYVMNKVAPFLDQVSRVGSHIDPIFNLILGIQEQLLKCAPEIVAPAFTTWPKE
jgi:hypothetical protein